MRIALQTEIPDLVDQLQSFAPGIEAIVLASADEPGEHLMAPFFADVMAFSNGQPLQGVVDTAACY